MSSSSTRTFVLVGHCGPDMFMLKSAVMRHVPGARIETVKASRVDLTTRPFGIWVGDPDGADRALTAGADGFLEKPVATLGQFQSTILGFLPQDRQPQGPRPVNGDSVDPDQLALRDDLGHAAAVLADPEKPEIDYVTQFLGGLARSVSDHDLGEAALTVAQLRASNRPATEEIAALKALIDDRLAGTRPF